ncbi:hypothetical protein T484DRAFT_1843705 [Baffinella frigidus]|nr:hypothetical protein T484DRAFT_1843705 [Cryptophyta sp. CCMP2293]
MWRTVREYLATAARDRRNASGPGGGRRKPPPRPPNPPPESEEQTGQKQRRSWFGRGCRRPYKNMMDLQLVHTFGGAGGIMKGCTKSTARKAYHKLSLEYHPDKANERGLDKKCSEENFIDIQQAYERAKDLCR